MIQQTYFCDICREDFTANKHEQLVGFRVIKVGVISKIALSYTERHICRSCLAAMRALSNQERLGQQ